MRSNAKISFAIAAIASFFAFAGQALAAPAVSIDPGPTTTYTTISGSGTVDPGDQDVGVYAEYATDPGGPWGEKLVRQIAANAGPTPVSYEITGLAAGTQYYIRLNAWTGAYNVSDVITATTLPADPPSATIDPVTAIGPEGAHFSGEVDTATGPDPVDANWHFECVPECPGLTGGVVSAGESTTVEADANGLLPATLYEVSLVAKGEGGQQIAGPESFTTLTAQPKIASIEVRRQSTEAILESFVNPGGAETTYHFEYGPTDGYGQSTAPKTLPAGSASVSVWAKLTGLQPDTAYHVRLVATNAEGTVNGPDVTFTTQPLEVAGNCPNESVRRQQGATKLPECRAYEQVSPADKNGFPVYWRPLVGTATAANSGLSAVAGDGETAVFTSWGVFAGSGGSLNQTYRSRRTPAGWVTAPGSSPINALHAWSVSEAVPTWLAASADLREGLMITSNSWSPLDPNQLAVPGTEYEAADAYLRTPADEDVLISLDPETGIAAERMSQNFNHAAIAGNGGHVLFESRVPLTPAAAAQENKGFNVYERDGDTTRLVSTGPTGGPADPECGARLAVPASSGQSADGSRVVFRTGGSDEQSENIFCQLLPKVKQLYVRIDGERTIHFTKSQRSEPDPGGVGEAVFVGGDESFSKILFSSSESLTDGADLMPGEKIYEFDVGTEQLTALTNDATAVGIWGASSDASSVFYVTADTRTLKRWSPAGVEEIASVATGSLNPAQGTPAFAASDDGETMVFLAAQNLTGYDSSGRDQAYLYRAGQPLRCLSCGSPADPPTDAHIEMGDGTSGKNVGDVGYYGSSITPDGSLVVFDTATKLLPSDTNNRRDVYQYDVATERLSLVSEGSRASDAYVYGVSDSGRDVFFTTSAALLPSDVDGGDSDIYDARRAGGFPFGDEGAKFVCSGEACQGAAPPAPVRSTSASSQLVGPGNAKPRRKGRCQQGRSGKAAAKASAKAKKRNCGRRKHQKAHQGKASVRRATARTIHGKGR